MEKHATVSHRSWKHKFNCAYRGLKCGIRGHSSFSVHFFATILVILLAFCLKCSQLEWAVLFLCIGMVIGFELANSTIEILVRCLPVEERPKFYPALDAAAGTVLFVSFIAFLSGILILLPKATGMLFLNQ